MDIGKSVLLIIDIQEKLIRSAFNNEKVENRASILAKTASVLGIPVIVTEQYPKGLGSTIEPIKNVLPENTAVLEKTCFNAFAEKNILETFKKLKRKHVIICGIETHICVFQTAEWLAKNGYEATIIADACGSRSEYEHVLGLENLKDFAKIKTTEMVLFELLKTAKHPNFKELQALIK